MLGLPHTGTELPNKVASQLNATGLALADTDWHIHELYDGLAPDATTVRTTIHRYVIDVNRDPAGRSLYPGQNTTELCPLTDFDGLPLYQAGKEPDAAEIGRRRARYHAPYHAALRAELERAQKQHGFAVLYDCHSIRSVIPYLFDGTLPDLNVGTNSGASCSAEVESKAWKRAASSPYSTVLNGRFKGGWTTRHYGRPEIRVHAVQMELAQRVYLTKEAPPWEIDTQKAARLRPWLKDILDTIVEVAEELHR